VHGQCRSVQRAVALELDEHPPLSGLGKLGMEGQGRAAVHAILRVQVAEPGQIRPDQGEVHQLRLVGLEAGHRLPCGLLIRKVNLPAALAGSVVVAGIRVNPDVAAERPSPEGISSSMPDIPGMPPPASLRQQGRQLNVDAPLTIATPALHIYPRGVTGIVHYSLPN